MYKDRVVCYAFFIPHDSLFHKSHNLLLADFGGIYHQKKLTNSKPRCLLEHEETNDEMKKTDKKKDRVASLEGKPLSTCVAKVEEQQLWASKI